MTRKITRAAAKAKGRRLQQYTAEQVSKLLDLPWGRDQFIDSRPGSQNGVDVILIGEALERFPFSVECKYHEKFALPAWIRQARQNTLLGTDWLVVFRKNRFDPCVVFDGDVLTKYNIQVDLCVEYKQKSWRIEEWVSKIRATTDSWLIHLNDFILMDMEQFFKILKENDL